MVIRVCFMKSQLSLENKACPKCSGCLRNKLNHHSGPGASFSSYLKVYKTRTFQFNVALGDQPGGRTYNPYAELRGCLFLQKSVAQSGCLVELTRSVILLSCNLRDPTKWVLYAWFWLHRISVLSREFKQNYDCMEQVTRCFSTILIFECTLNGSAILSSRSLFYTDIGAMLQSCNKQHEFEILET